MQAGDALPDVVGPLGKATEIENFGHVVLVGGGVGTAVIYPQAGALKAKGNHVSAIIGGRFAPYVILEKELAAICDAVYPCTDDGSYGFTGSSPAGSSELIADPAHPVNAVITRRPGADDAGRRRASPGRRASRPSPRSTRSWWMAPACAAAAASGGRQE